VEEESKDAWKMWKEIGDREAGQLRPKSFASRIKSNRIGTLQLSNHKDIVSPHRGSINSLQVLFFFFFLNSVSDYTNYTEDNARSV
jgi:hypothetical protein